MTDCEPYGFIYITTNLVNGKKYIGQRKYNNGWERYLGSGVSLKNAIKKYGKGNFSRQIIHFGHSKEELNELEVYYISKYNAVESDEYYNIADGGGSGNTFAGKSEEEMNEICKKKSKALSGKQLSEEHKKKLCESHTGKKHSEATKKKMSESKVGKNLTEEHKKKLSESRIGKYTGKNSPMYGRTGISSTNHKPIICITTGEIFSSAKEAAKKYNISNKNICSCCKNMAKSAGKHPETGEKLVWEYYIIELT